MSRAALFQGVLIKVSSLGAGLPHLADCVKCVVRGSALPFIYYAANVPRDLLRPTMMVSFGTNNQSACCIFILPGADA